MWKYHTILLSFSLLLNFSCKSDNNKHEKYLAALSNEIKVTSADRHIQNQDYSKIYFPSVKLLNKQTLTINYSSTGCFHYYKETIRITKNENNYKLTYIKKQGDKDNTLISDSLIDLSFISSLETFSNNCKECIKQNLENGVNKNNTYSTTSRSLTVSDGLHLIDVPVENTNPYGELIAAIDKNKSVY